MIIAVYCEHQRNDPTPVAQIELSGDCDVSYWAAIGHTIAENPGQLPGSTGL